MKTIILFLMLVSVPSWASQNWYPVGKEGASSVYPRAADCKEKEGQDCMDITGKDLRYYMAVDVEVDDYTKPVWTSKYKVANCEDAPDCQEKVRPYALDYDKPLAERYCDKDARDQLQWGANDVMPGYSYWCWRQEGWEKKNVKELQEDSEKKAQVEADDASMAQQAADLTAVKVQMDRGRNVLALINLRNAPKNLSRGQVKAMIQTYSDIKSLLESGALQTARDEIADIEPDATIVTAEDKAAILAELDKYLGE